MLDKFDSCISFNFSLGHRLKLVFIVVYFIEKRNWVQFFQHCCYLVWRVCMNDFSFLTTHFTQQNHLWSHQNLPAILCSLGCNEPYLPIAEMPTCGDLKSRDFFLDQHIPPHVTPLQKILFQSGPYTPPPPQQFCRKNMDLSVRDFN